MKQVLVIGANSYIGKELHQYIINQKKDIKVTLISASDGSWKKISFSSFDVIIHLSAIVHRKEKKNMASLYYDINYKLASQIAEKAKNNNVGQFIFMSTAAVFHPDSECITKNTAPNPITFYGKSKLAAEQAIMKLQEDTFQVSILRTPMVYGEGCKGNYAKLVQLAKLLPVFPDYHNQRSMVHINRLCEFVVNVIEEEMYGYLYPQDEQYIDTCELFVKLRKDMGKRTWKLKGMDVMIKWLIVHNKNIRKMFGDFYYNKD